MLALRRLVGAVSRSEHPRSGRSYISRMANNNSRILLVRSISSSVFRKDADKKNEDEVSINSIFGINENRVRALFLKYYL